ncbi:MAG: hypothetical protein ACRDVP_08400 [Acidimicrobiales bacterium]
MTSVMAWRRVAVPALVGGSGAAVALVVWEGGLFRDSAAAHWSVLATIAVVISIGALRSQMRRRALGDGVKDAPSRSKETLLGAAIWLSLALAAVAWDLNSFIAQRHDLPTLSGVIGLATANHPGRSAVFALWLASGMAVALWDRRR